MANIEEFLEYGKLRIDVLGRVVYVDNTRMKMGTNVTMAESIVEKFLSLS